MPKLIGSWSLLFCLLDLQLEVVLAFSLHRTGFSSSIGGNRLADLPIVSKSVITRGMPLNEISRIHDKNNG